MESEIKEDQRKYLNEIGMTTIIKKPIKVEELKKLLQPLNMIWNYLYYFNFKYNIKNVIKRIEDYQGPCS